MKSIGIITIYDNNNYGNRLQNYATQIILQKFNIGTVETIKNEANLNIKRNIVSYNLRKVKNFYEKIKNKNPRKKYFSEFNKNICLSKKVFDYYNLNKFKYDYYIVGSDQVWNPSYRLNGFDLVDFSESKNKIAFAASFAVSELPININKDEVSEHLSKFKQISVREDDGKEIVKSLINRKDIEVLIDPTMLLTSKEWDKVIKKPKQFDKLKNKRYILNYFLGKLSKKREEEIERIAKENNCCVINILDKNDPFYETGPSEFLYLEKNAFMICTDSFHSSVFAILYNRPFIVFDREQEGIVSMNSRIETLISKFKLDNRRFEGRITTQNLKHNYTEAYKILEAEKEKSLNFLKKSLDIK